MSENLNRGARDFSKYDTMATADLEEILRLDAELPEGAESDTERLFYVMGVLADRRRNSGNAGKTAFEAWESFEKNYMPEEDAAPESAGRKTGLRFTPWLRRAVAAAAVLALLVCVPVTAKAFGLGDVWNIVARWAKETFSFVRADDDNFSEPDPNSQEQFASLQEALQITNEDPNIVPTWVPSGFTLSEIIINENPIQKTYFAHYVFGERELAIHVCSYIDADPRKKEINENVIEIYNVDDIDFHIFSNMDELHVIWLHASYECSIIGDIDIEEAKKMIHSIGKG